MLRNAIRTAVGAGALLIYALPPLQASATLVLRPGSPAVYDSAHRASWLADANLPAFNRFGLAVCTGSGPQARTFTSKLCEED